MALTLLRQHHPLSTASEQLRVLSEVSGTPLFRDKLAGEGMPPLRTRKIEVLQVNVGKVCNQTCRHCHVDAGPERKESMSLETVEQCLDVLRRTDIPTLDITGGAPELNPHFRPLVVEARRLGRHVIDRCNLTILLAPGFQDLGAFLAEHQVEIVASLPCYLEKNVDAQRGDGVYEKSIRAIQQLNTLGYGREGSGLTLTLVFNPGGASLPPDQKTLEADLSQGTRRKIRHRLHTTLHDHQHADQPISGRPHVGWKTRHLHGKTRGRVQSARGRVGDVPQHAFSRMGWSAFRLRLQPDARHRS